MNRGGGGGGVGGGGYDDGPIGGWGSSRGGPPSMGGGGGNPPMVNARGLPFRATEQDVADFFHPIEPINVHIIFEGGRPSGRAEVVFASHEDALEAMKKNKDDMQGRYIELFLHSEPERPYMGGGMGGSPGPMRGGGYGNDYNGGAGGYRNGGGNYRRF